jgi:hypothetical protein
MSTTVASVLYDWAWSASAAPGTLTLHNATGEHPVGQVTSGSQTKLGVIVSLTLPALASGYVRVLDTATFDGGATNFDIRTPYTGHGNVTGYRVRLADVMNASAWTTTTNTPSSPLYATDLWKLEYAVTAPGASGVIGASGLDKYVAKYGMWAGTRYLQYICEDMDNVWNRCGTTDSSYMIVHIYYNDIPAFKLASAVGLNRGINAGFNRGGQL